MFARLLIPRPLLDAMAAHARAEWPNECCGLLAGTIAAGVGRITHHFPLRNDLASPSEYRTNARDLLDATRAMRAVGVDVLAIYHSHPASEPLPSRKDIEGNTWGETVAHVILGLAGDEPEVRAWRLTESDYRPVEWIVTE